MEKPFLFLFSGKLKLPAEEMDAKKKDLEKRKAEFVRIRDYAEAEIAKMMAEEMNAEGVKAEEEAEEEGMYRGQRFKFLEERGADITIGDLDEFSSWTYDELHSLYLQFKPKHATETFASSPYKTHTARISDLKHYFRLHSCKTCGRLAHHTEDHSTTRAPPGAKISNGGKASSNCVCRQTFSVSDSTLDDMATYDLNHTTLTCTDYIHYLNRLHPELDSSSIVSSYNNCSERTSFLKDVLSQKACTRCGTLSHPTSKHLRFIIDISGADMTKHCFMRYFKEWTANDLTDIYFSNRRWSPECSRFASASGREVTDIEGFRDFVLRTWPEKPPSRPIQIV